jgi:hypothetical protein
MIFNVMTTKDLFAKLILRQVDDDGLLDPMLFKVLEKFHSVGEMQPEIDANVEVSDDEIDNFTDWCDTHDVKYECIRGARCPASSSRRILDLQEHLGDGVYAEYDGYSVNLRVNDHRNPVAVILEPEVMKALIEFYARKVKEKETGKEYNEDTERDATPKQ